ncbi:hypothetical protein Ancab_012383 [Ancistrocladus abbreviatus]
MLGPLTTIAIISRFVPIVASNIEAMRNDFSHLTWIVRAIVTHHLVPILPFSLSPKLESQPQPQPQSIVPSLTPMAFETSITKPTPSASTLKPSILGDQERDVNGLDHTTAPPSGLPQNMEQNSKRKSAIGLKCKGLNTSGDLSPTAKCEKCNRLPSISTAKDNIPLDVFSKPLSEDRVSKPNHSSASSNQECKSCPMDETDRLCKKARVELAMQGSEALGITVIEQPKVIEKDYASIIRSGLCDKFSHVDHQKSQQGLVDDSQQEKENKLQPLQT